MNIILLDQNGREVMDPAIKDMDRSLIDPMKTRINHLTHATARGKIPLDEALVMAYLQGRLDVELDNQQDSRVVKFDA